MGLDSAKAFVKHILNWMPILSARAKGINMKLIYRWDEEIYRQREIDIKEAHQNIEQLSFKWNDTGTHHRLISI